MNKIIIVGHQSSGLEDVESLLRRGVKSALPSRREGLFPAEITTNVCKAHQTPDIDSLTLESDFRQIEPGTIWNGLMLDLELANASQSPWGWADPRSIFLLDYWKTLDPLAAFVLVYDQPHRALEKAMMGATSTLDDPAIQRLLDNWAAYNGAMLRFFLRNPDRCILVQSQQLLATSDSTGSIFGRLGITLDRNDPEPQAQPYWRADSGGHPGHSFAPLHQLLQETLELTGDLTCQVIDTIGATTAEQHLIESYLNGQTIHLQLFDELQAAADLPLHNAPSGIPSTRMAMNDLAVKRQVLQLSLNTINLHLRKIHEEHRLALMQLKQAQEELKGYYSELEKYYSENTLLKKEAARIRAERDSKPPLLGAAERVKQQLSYRLGATMVTKSKSLGGLLTMPFALVGEARRFHRRQKTSGRQNQPPLRDYDDAQEALRIKQQLSYRLGHILVHNVRSPTGVVKLPYAIVREAISFKRNRRKRNG